MGDGSNRFERSAKWQGKLSALHYVVVVMYRQHLHCHQNGLVSTSSCYTTPRTAPTALLRAQNSVAVLPLVDGMFWHLRQIIFTSKSGWISIYGYMLLHVAALRSCY